VVLSAPKREGHSGCVTFPRSLVCLFFRDSFLSATLLNGTLSSPIPNAVVSFFPSLVPCHFSRIDVFFYHVWLGRDRWPLSRRHTPLQMRLISLHLSLSSPSSLPSPDLPYILAMFPHVLLPSFHRYPLRFFFLHPSLPSQFAYFTIPVSFLYPSLPLPTSFSVEGVFGVSYTDPPLPVV